MLNALRWHGKTLAALARVAVPRPWRRLRSSLPELPGHDQKSVILPRPAELLEAYRRHFGIDPGAYRGELPPHLFAQWTLGPALLTLLGLPYPMHRGLNAGCELDIKGPLPADVPLALSTRLESIDEDERRVLFVVSARTGPRRQPDALTARLTFILPRRHKREKKAPAVVPMGADKLGTLVLDGQAGRAFARLTGDFNPIHWFRPYARLMGHESVILHGYAQMAHVMETVVQARCGGDAKKLKRFTARFAAPLVLPAEVSVFEAGELYLGRAPGERAVLTGSFTRA